MDDVAELETLVEDPLFFPSWRSFLAEVARLLLPHLPPEATAWSRAADRFDEGTASLNELSEARTQAHQFINHAQASAAEVSGINAIVWRLSPREDPRHWYESASYLLDFAAQGGVSDDTLAALLRKHFAVVPKYLERMAALATRPTAEERAAVQARSNDRARRLFGLK